LNFIKFFSYLFIYLFFGSIFNMTRWGGHDGTREGQYDAESATWSQDSGRAHVGGAAEAAAADGSGQGETNERWLATDSFFPFFSFSSFSLRCSLFFSSFFFLLSFFG